MNYDKNILVVGGNGLLGSGVIKKLKQHGYTNIKATYNTRYPIEPVTDVEYIQCNLLDVNEIKKAMLKVNWVVMAAANSSGAAVMNSDPLVHVTPNIIMNALTLETAYKCGVEKFLWFGSTTAYPVRNYAIKEDELLVDEPFEKYYAVGWMKRYTEVLCKLYAEKLKDTMPCIVLRPTNVYGPNDRFDPKTSHVLPALIRRAVEKEMPMAVWSDGSEIRDFIYIDDLAEVTVTALREVEKYDVFNIGYGKEYSVKEIIPYILKAAELETDIVYGQKPTMIPFRAVNINKAKDILHFNPKVDIEEGIKLTAQWLKENINRINK